MAQSSEAFLKLMGSGDEADRWRVQMEKEKNPKQILIDWVESVRREAVDARQILDKNIGCTDDEEAREVAMNRIMTILGQCQIMMTVLNNSD